MRILSLTTIYPNEKVAAEGRSVAFLDRALAKLGVQGTTLVLKPWAPQWLASRVEKWKHLAVQRQVLEQDNQRIVFSYYLHVPHRFQKNFCVYSMAYQAIRLVRKHGWEFDIVHGQSIYPAALAARLVARHFQVPFMVTLRDDLSHLSHWYEHERARELFEPMFASVSAIFVHGPSLLRDIPNFIPLGAHPEILMAPNGVDQEGIQAILDSLSPPIPRPWGSIVSVSSLYRLKGVHENLQALRLLDERGLRSWKYTIVGDGPYRKELQGLCKDLGLEPKVAFAGKVPYPEAIRYIRESDIFCLPSWAESFGNVYAEAAVCGRPSIGCKGFGGEITIRDGETGLLVPPKDVDALAGAIGFLLSHPDQARKMGQAGRDHIRVFTWDRTAELYKQTISNLLSGESHHNDKRTKKPVPCLID
jgi:glycosyltransferase involved in cell wall biosynthesis